MKIFQRSIKPNCDRALTPRTNDQRHCSRDRRPANAPICNDVPPEGWSKEDKAVFDQAYEVACRARGKVMVLFDK